MKVPLEIVNYCASRSSFMVQVKNLCSVLPFDPPKSIYFGKSIIPNLNWPMKVKLHAK